MTTQNGPETRTDMVLSPRQEKLVALRDDMRAGEKPGAIVPRTFAEVEVMCKALAGAGLIPAQYRERPMDMIFTVMSGAELGLPPMASLRLYHNIEGKLSLGAEGIRSVILQSPDCEYFEFAESSPTRAVWIGKRPGRPEKSITWTIERAKQAGLVGKPTWTKSPEDMLNARASMQLGRLNWPHIMAGMISREELQDGVIDAEFTEAPKFTAPPAGRVQVQVVEAMPAAAAPAAPAAPKERRTRAPAAPVPTSLPVSSASSSAGEATPQNSAGSSTASTESAPAEGVVLDRWGQAVAHVEAKNANPIVSPAKAEAAYAAVATSSPIASASSTESTSAPSSGAGFSCSADDMSSGFEDEDPVDSTPVYDQAGFVAWLASVTSQSQLTREADPWIAWNGTIGDPKIPAKLRPEVVANRKLYAARKAELPL